jgi:hypothetical protein
MFVNRASTRSTDATPRIISENDLGKERYIIMAENEWTFYLLKLLTEQIQALQAENAYLKSCSALLREENEHLKANICSDKEGAHG